MDKMYIFLFSIHPSIHPYCIALHSWIHPCTKTQAITCIHSHTICVFISCTHAHTQTHIHSLQANLAFVNRHIYIYVHVHVHIYKHLWWWINRSFRWTGIISYLPYIPSAILLRFMGLLSFPNSAFRLFMLCVLLMMWMLLPFVFSFQQGFRFRSFSDSVCYDCAVVLFSTK